LGILNYIIEYIWGEEILKHLLLKLLPQKNISESDLNKGIKALILDGSCFQAMLVLTSGAFLTAFAVELGASNFIIAVIAAIGPLCQILQIPSIFLIERYHYRKIIVFSCAATARVLWIPLAFLPWFISPSKALLIMLFLILIMNLLGAPAACAWNSWIRSFVPEEKFNTLFPKRLAYAIGSGAVLSLVAGFVVDRIKILCLLQTTPYSISFLLGTAFGLIGLIFIAKIPEPVRHIKPEGENRILKTLGKPFKNQEYKKLILFMGIWSFATNMALPFFVVYMIRYLNIDIFMIIILSVINQSTTFAFYGIWGRLSNKFSNKSCLAVSSTLFIISIGCWTMAEEHVLIIPFLIALHILMGVATAGFSLCSNNLMLKLSPKHDSTAYLAACSMTVGLSAAIAPIVAVLVEKILMPYQFTFTLRFISNGTPYYLTLLDYWKLDFIFLISCGVAIYAVTILSKLKESGEKNPKGIYPELMFEIGQGLRSVSSVVNLRVLLKRPKTKK